jgi:hypothetical protein
MPDLCASNRQLNETEVSRILHAISEADSDVAELVQEIKTNPQDTGIRQRYITYIHFLEEHKGLLSPVRRFPTRSWRRFSTFVRTIWSRVGWSPRGRWLKCHAGGGLLRCLFQRFGVLSLR